MPLTPVEQAGLLQSHVLEQQTSACATYRDCCGRVITGGVCRSLRTEPLQGSNERRSPSNGPGSGASKMYSSVAGSLSQVSRDQLLFFSTNSGEVCARNSERRNMSSSENSPSSKTSMGNFQDQWMLLLWWTFLPGMNLGPVMTRTISGSVELIFRMLTGRIPAIPRIEFSIVEVRDFADLHIQAMLAPQVAGQRILGVGTFLWMADTARLLRENLGQQASKCLHARFPTSSFVSPLYLSTKLASWLQCPNDAHSST